MNDFKFEETCVKIATLWGYGISCTFLAALPIIALLHLTMYFSTKNGLWLFAFIAIASLIVTFVAFKDEQPKQVSGIVLDKTIGLVVAFLFVPIWFRIKLLLFGLVLFYFFLFLQRYMILEELYPSFKSLPSFIRIFLDDYAAGILVNLFLQMVIWVTR